MNPRTISKSPIPLNLQNSFSISLQTAIPVLFIVESNMTTGEGFKGRVQQRSSTKGNGGGSSSVNGGNPRCKCGEEAKVRVSRTDANPGKAFYCCYLPKVWSSSSFSSSSVLIPLFLKFTCHRVMSQTAIFFDG